MHIPLYPSTLDSERIQATFHILEGEVVKGMTPAVRSVPLDDIFGDGFEDLVKKQGGFFLTYAEVRQLANQLGIVEYAPPTLMKVTEDKYSQHIFCSTVSHVSTLHHTCYHTHEVGEASTLNTGKWSQIGKPPNKQWKHSEIGQVSAMYRASVARKRAYVRAVLQHVNLYHIVKSVEESDQFEKKREKVVSQMPTINLKEL